VDMCWHYDASGNILDSSQCIERNCMVLKIYSTILWRKIHIKH